MAEADDNNALELPEFEAAPRQEIVRTDLFGEGESDEEDELIRPAEDPDGQLAPVDERQQQLTPALQAEGLTHHNYREGSYDETPNEAEKRSKEEPTTSQQDAGRHDDIFGTDSEDDDRHGMASEAESEDEMDEFEALFRTGKKRKKKGQAQEIVATVETLIANMEVAAEMDIAANEEGKPAVNKIKMLPQVEEKLSQSMLHRELLDGGVLGALKLWMELLPNGALPNVKVRTSILKMLHKLPIDLNMEGRKEQLKKSELGKYVMFYSKLPEETMQNRQLARTLVEKWSRPIFDQYREQGQDEELQEREAELARLRKKRRIEMEQATAPKAEEAAKNLKPGDPGFRWHARIPAPARLDYMRLPDSLVGASEGEAVKGKAKPKDRMSKKLAAMSRKGSRKSGEGKISLQGRGLLL